MSDPPALDDPVITANPLEAHGPSSTAQTPQGRPSYVRTLRNRPFLLLWAAQLVSQSGDFIFEVALLWLVLEFTGSALAVGIVVTGTILPAVFVGPFLGVYVDRWDRRRTLVVTNVVEGIVVAALSGLILAGKISLPGLFATVLVLGAGSSMVRVATNAYVPSVVPRDDLPPANGLLSISSSMNQIVGLSLGGAFVALLGVALPIEYDAASFFAAALLLLLIPRPGTASDAVTVGGSSRFRDEFAEGVRWIRQNRFMVEIIVIGVLVNFLGNGLAALFAPYTEFVLHAGPVIYGLLGAFVAAGSLLGAVVLGKVSMRSSAGRYLFAGGVCLGPLLVLVGLVTSIPFALTLMLLLGVALAVTNLPISVAIQAKVPGRLLGRVSATFGALVVATGPAGPVFAGWFAERYSVGSFFVLSGIVMTIVIGLGAVTMTSLRSLRY